MVAATVQMNAMYEYVLAKRRAMEAQARELEAGMNVKPKYEYDSDEDTEGGTWEHKRRVFEMEATRGFWALYLRWWINRCNIVFQTPWAPLPSSLWCSSVMMWYQKKPAGFSYHVLNVFEIT